MNPYYRDSLARQNGLKFKLRHYQDFAPSDAALPAWVGRAANRKQPMEPRKHPEEDLQIKCFEHLESLGEKILSWATPNHIYASKNSDPHAFAHYMDRQRKMGLRKGVLDLIILKKGYRFQEVEVIFIELKIGDNDYTDEQEQFARRAEVLGCKVFKVYTFEEFLDALKAAGL